MAVNNNEPFFTDSDMITTAFENYSDLDSLGRCGVAYANICQEIMPTEKRGAIGMVISLPARMPIRRILLPVRDT